MQKITQTGHIPINSIGLIFSNYFRWFKVFCVFYLIPFIIFLLTLFLTHKEKIFTLLQTYKTYWLVSKTGIATMIPAQEKVLNQSLSAFVSPSFFIIVCLGLIVGLICYSCLIVGIKHCFYSEVKIGNIFKEGFVRLPDFLWTNISFIIMFILSYLVCFAILFVPIKLLTFDRNLFFVFIIPLILLAIFIWSFFIFYIPIHFFSKNNPISSMWCSMKTFWKNFGFIIVFGIVIAVVSVLVSLLIGMIAYFIMRHYITLPAKILFPIILNIILPLVYALLPYLNFRLISFFIVFIAYPELLDEEEENDNAIIIESTDVREDNQNNINILSPIESDNSLGLSQQRSSHQNTRPFLNEKISNTLFEKLTSREIDTPETSDTQETLDTSDKTGSQGE